MNRRRTAVAALAVTAALVVAACQPPRPTTGPGSVEAYVASSATVTDVGSGSAGTRVLTYVLDVLRDGTSAPVVVLLHGFFLSDPNSYSELIDHLTRQGLIVVFPAYNKGGLGIFDDNDQNAMAARAVASVDGAVAALGATADLSQVYLWGHSLGGLVASAWTGLGGIAPAGIVLANPSTSAGPPDFVPVETTPIPWEVLAPATTAPVVILTGDDDTIAPPAESIALHDAMASAASRVVWELQDDRTQSPAIDADHMAPLAGGNDVDTADWRYYWAALDQLVAGDATPAFAMGSWQNGRPVTPPIQLR